ncbi:MAG: hypothetical protein K0S00_3097 [Xanthobacteraceae bacterium]|jgi:hypothetical protein|nr:hypothetical protein [Xanthobacteraceae bacterium]
MSGFRNEAPTYDPESDIHDLAVLAGIAVSYIGDVLQGSGIYDPKGTARPLSSEASDEILFLVAEICRRSSAIRRSMFGG